MNNEKILQKFDLTPLPPKPQKIESLCCYFFKNRIPGSKYNITNLN